MFCWTKCCSQKNAHKLTEIIPSWKEQVLTCLMVLRNSCLKLFSGGFTFSHLAFSKFIVSLQLFGMPVNSRFYWWDTVWKSWNKFPSKLLKSIYLLSHLPFLQRILLQFLFIDIFFSFLLFLKTSLLLWKFIIMPFLFLYVHILIHWSYSQ